MLKICAFLVKILFWQMQNAVLVSKFCKKFAYAFYLQGQNAFVSLFDGINLRYKNHARQKS